MVMLCQSNPGRREGCRVGVADLRPSPTPKHPCLCISFPTSRQWQSRLGDEGRLTLYVEQLILDRDLRLAPGFRFAVDHTLVISMRLKIHEASLHVVHNVRSIGRDFFGGKLPVERDFGCRCCHSTRNHSLSVRVQPSLSWWTLSIPEARPIPPLQGRNRTTVSGSGSPFSESRRESFSKKH